MAQSPPKQAILYHYNLVYELVSLNTKWKLPATKIYHVLAPKLSILHYDYHHATDEEIKAQKLNRLPKIIMQKEEPRFKSKTTP